MKKNICVILVMVTFLLLIGCSKVTTPNNPPPTGTKGSEPTENVVKSKIENYYPF